MGNIAKAGKTTENKRYTQENSRKYNQTKATKGKPWRNIGKPKKYREAKEKCGKPTKAKENHGEQRKTMESQKTRNRVRLPPYDIFEKGGNKNQSVVEQEKKLNQVISTA